MRIYVLFLCLAVSVPLYGARLSTAGGDVFYPSVGVINPEQGTVQLTVTPNVDLDKLRDGWPFAFRVCGREGTRATRTAIGVFSAPGKNEGLSSVIRGGKSRFGTVDRNSPVRAGQRVNIALTWGPAGFFFYVGGRLVGSARFPDRIIPLSPYFYVGALGPFFVSRIAVSAEQFPKERLHFDSSRPFPAEAGDALLANDLTKPHFSAAPEFRKSGFISFVPFDLTSSRILYEDEQPVLRFLGNNFSEKTVTLPVRMTLESMDHGSHTVTRTVTLPADSIQKTVAIPLSPLPAGFYQVTVRAGELEPRSFTLSVQPRIAGTAGKLADYLGAAGTAEPEILARLGIRWMRSWGRPDFVWYMLEPADGRFDFRTADALVDGARANGVNTLAVLGYPPLWAAEPPAPSAENERYSGQPGRWKPRSVEEWSRYVRRTAEHFKGRVGFYEVYNECDFKTPGKPASFSGTTEDYFELLKGAYGAVRSADPASKVLVTGFSMVRGAVDTAMPADLLKLGAADYVDIWNLHSYQVLYNVPEMKRMVHAQKPGMPFWQTEHMWHILKDRSRVRYLVSAINFWFLQERFEKFFTFGWNEYLNDERTHSLTLSLHIFGVCQQFLRICSGYAGTHPGLPADDFDVRHVLRRTDGGYLTAVGSSVGSYALEIANRDAAVYNESGRKVSLKNGTLETGDRLHYVLTEEPLKIVSRKLLKSGQLIANRDFEEISGDAMGGIEHCDPAGWIIRTKFDPAAKVTINTKDGNGKYALNLTTSGKGRVYVFQYLKITAPGTYRITAHFKTLSGAAKPFLYAYGTAPEDRCCIRKDFAVPSSEKFEKVSMEVFLPRVPEKPLAVIFGVDRAAGTAVLDDVEMLRLENLRVEEGNAIRIPLSGTPFSAVWTEARREIPFPLMKNAVGRKAVAGIPFASGNELFAVGGTDWNGVPRIAGVEFAPCLFKRLFLLGNAMYCGGKRGTVLANLLLHYEDGEERTLPLRLGIELGDWFNPVRKQPLPAVIFHSPSYAEYGLFLCEWKNPLPGKKLKRIELHAVSKRAVVAIPSITLERGGK